MKPEPIVTHSWDITLFAHKNDLVKEIDHIQKTLTKFVSSVLSCV